MSKNSRSGHILYLMVHVPFVWWWKIGITGQTAGKRAKNIDGQMFGFPFPIFFVIMPGAYRFEQFLHRQFSGLNIVFYKGSGKNEWFWFPVAAFVLLIMAAIWGLYFGIFWVVYNFT